MTAAVLAAAVGAIYLAMPRDRVEHTRVLSPEGSRHELARTFGMPETDSVRVEECLVRSLPQDSLGSYDLVGCRISWGAAPMTRWLGEISGGKPALAVRGIAPELGLMPVGRPFDVRAVYGRVSPEQWDIDSALVYTNAERTEAVMYQRLARLAAGAEAGAL